MNATLCRSSQQQANECCLGVLWGGLVRTMRKLTQDHKSWPTLMSRNSALAWLQCLIEAARNALHFFREHRNISNCEGHGLPCSPDFITAPWWTPSAAAPLQLETQKRPTISPGRTARSVLVHCVVSVCLSIASKMLLQYLCVLH